MGLHAGQFGPWTIRPITLCVVYCNGKLALPSIFLNLYPYWCNVPYFNWICSILPLDCASRPASTTFHVIHVAISIRIRRVNFNGWCDVSLNWSLQHLSCHLIVAYDQHAVDNMKCHEQYWGLENELICGQQAVRKRTSLSVLVTDDHHA